MAGRRDVYSRLPDESFVDAWRVYTTRAAVHGFLTLADYLIELQFPIVAGISATEEYRDAIWHGVVPRRVQGAPALALVSPAECSVAIQSTWAGSIPIIHVGHREDFVSIVQALTHRNEPVPVADSMGSCLVRHYTNWDRVRSVCERSRFAAKERISREHCQDAFIILSSGWYSGVPPAEMGVGADEWRVLSQVIRSEHECAHYWMRRVGRPTAPIVDEIVADFCGLLAAFGRVRRDWILTVLGIDGDQCRRGGRLHNYRHDVSAAVFALTCRRVAAAAAHLEAFQRRHASALQGKVGMLLALLALSGMSLDDLASADAPDLLTARIRCACAAYHSFHPQTVTRSAEGN